MAKKFLSRNKNLAIIPADKGNRTVIMNKVDYESKMTELLSDENIYKKLAYDATDSLQARLIHISTRLVKSKAITQEQANGMIMRNSAISKAYGQPKLHKAGNPLRILVASYESPAYKVSQFLVAT